MIHNLEDSVLVWTILGLAFIGFIQVFSRYILNYSFTWYEELGRYLGVFIAFLGGAIGVRTGSHFTMDLVVRSLPGPLRRQILLAGDIVSGSFFLFVAYYSIKIVKRLYGYETTSPTLEMPMYIAYLPIPVFSIIIGLRFYGTGITRFIAAGSGVAGGTR